MVWFQGPHGISRGKYHEAPRRKPVRSKQKTKDPKAIERKWRASFFRNIPWLSLLALLVTFLIAGAMGALYYCVGWEEDELRMIEYWGEYTPNAWFSAMVTVAGWLIRFAFANSADIQWWANAVSGSTVQALQDQHGFSSKMLTPYFKPTTWGSIVRFASIATGLFSLSGPLVQRSISPDAYGNYTSNFTVELPIQIRPMWNLTANIDLTTNNYLYHKQSVYEPEFHQVILDITNRKSMQIRDKCDGNCTANVTIAGFERDCFSITEYNTTYVPLTWSSQALINGTIPNRLVDNLIPGVRDGKILDDYNNTHYLYQLDVQLFHHNSAREQPEGIAISSYTRTNSLTSAIAMHRCLLRPAYIDLKLTMVNSSVWWDSSGPLAYNRTKERMPTKIIADGVLAGFSQYLQNRFVWVAYFREDLGLKITPNALLYVNQGTFMPGLEGAKQAAFIDPMRNVLDLLDQISLRYAMTDIPSTPGRIRQWYEFWLYNENNPPPSHNLTTPTSKTQKVHMYQVKSAKIYRANYRIFAVAMFFFLLPIPFIFGSLFSYRKVGRNVSMSPFEIAKAFDAPALKSLECSNLETKEITKAVGEQRIKYGVIGLRQRHHSVGEKQAAIISEDPLAITSHSAGDSEYSDREMGTERLRLMMTENPDAMEPINGVVYR